MAKKSTGKKKPKKLTDKDWNVIKNLCAIQCSHEEIMSILEISYEDLQHASIVKWKEPFEHRYARWLCPGKVSLRRTQFKHADTAPQMAIWLGKQYLGQSDKIENKHSGEASFTVVNYGSKPQKPWESGE